MDFRTVTLEGTKPVEPEPAREIGRHQVTPTLHEPDLKPGGIPIHEHASTSATPERDGVLAGAGVRVSPMKPAAEVFAAQEDAKSR
jgi:hypothetical protein